MQFIKHIRF